MIPEIYINGINIGNIDIGGVDNISIDGFQIRSINSINTNNATIREISDARIWTQRTSEAVPIAVPVTVKVGTPIVNMPGCVKAHKENAKSPKNRNMELVNNDPKGNVVLCDGGMPYFEPPDYQANRLDWRTIYGEAPEAEGVKTNPPPPPQTPDTPEPPATPPTKTEDQPCPPPNARRIGDLNQAGTEKVSGYELIRDPKNYEEFICETRWESINFAEQYLPSPQIVTTTAVIASVAASSALLAKPLADLLLKVVKPLVKKVVGKVNSILGKTPYRPTQAELKTNEYRVKKGLLGINFAKEHQKREKAKKEAEKKKSQEEEKKD